MPPSDSRVVLVAHVDGAKTNDISKLLRDRGCRVLQACCAAEALKLCAKNQPPVILIDLFLPSTATRLVPASNADAATQLLRTIRRADANVQILALLNGQTSLSLCCRAVLDGFNGFVQVSEPSFDKILTDRIAQAFDRHQQICHAKSSPPPWEVLDSQGVVGVSPAWKKLLWHLYRTAQISDVPVLIQGQSGTGKQLLAEAIHSLDPKRRKEHFATVNCSAITGTLAESELFGHCKGAFTGATADRLGYFRSCNGGTLFLDEISELDINLQPKLLRVLQEGKVLPVGSDREYTVDVRIVASSNKPMAQLVADGEFRLDLYQRLKVVSLAVPPLRDRPEDIPLLVNAFLERYSHYYAGQIVAVDPKIYEILNHAKLPGNVRELENIIRHALVLKEAGSRLEISDLPQELIAQASQAPHQPSEFISAELADSFNQMLIDGQVNLPQLVDFFEKALITQAVDSCTSTYADLAKQLGLTRRTFYNKLQKHAIAQPSSS